VVASRDGSEGWADRVAAGGLTTTHTRLSVDVLRKQTEDASHLLETSSKACRSSRPHLAIGLQAFYHHLPLGLILPKVTEESFLIRIILIASIRCNASLCTT
jgi:hypothetical protein